MISDEHVKAFAFSLLADGGRGCFCFHFSGFQILLCIS